MNELQKRSLSVHVCERVCVKCSSVCRQDDGCRQHSVYAFDNAYGGSRPRCSGIPYACDNAVVFPQWDAPSSLCYSARDPASVDDTLTDTVERGHDFIMYRIR